MPYSIGGSKIAAGSTQDVQISVRPVSSAQLAICSPIAPLDSSWVGITWSAWLSAVNQVTIRLANITGAPITPTVQAFAVRTFEGANIP